MGFTPFLWIVPARLKRHVFCARNMFRLPLRSRFFIRNTPSEHRCINSENGFGFRPNIDLLFRLHSDLKAYRHYHCANSFCLEDNGVILTHPPTWQTVTFTLIFCSWAERWKPPGIPPRWPVYTSYTAILPDSHWTSTLIYSHLLEPDEKMKNVGSNSPRPPYSVCYSNTNALGCMTKSDI